MYYSIVQVARQKSGVIFVSVKGIIGVGIPHGTLTTHNVALNVQKEILSTTYRLKNIVPLGAWFRWYLNDFAEQAILQASLGSISVTLSMS